MELNEIIKLNKVVKYDYELWVLNEAELNEEPVYWLLKLLERLTKNNITYIIEKGVMGQYIITMRGKYKSIKSTLIKYEYETDESNLQDVYTD